MRRATMFGVGSVRCCLVLAVVMPALLTACGTTTSTGADVGSCPKDAVWDQNVDLRDPSGRTVPPDPSDPVATGSTADDAVAALATGIDTNLTVTATRPVDSTSVGGYRPDLVAPGDELELDVVDDEGRTGTYLLAHFGDTWSVSGGTGCGAPAPQGFGLDCPIPTPTPLPDDTETYSIFVACGEDDPG